MIYKRVKLREIYPALSDVGGEPTLDIYLHSNTREIDPNRTYPGMLICPGGAYAFVSDREADPIALKYLNEGYNCFVLTYSVAPARYPAHLMQAAAAMDYIRKNAAVQFTDPSKVAVIGFSAGGHLAASIGCLWHLDFLAEKLHTESKNLRPDAMVLCYAVITGGEKAHRGSFDNLCGDNEALVKELSLETTVRPDTPPAFLWHTMTDTCVPMENSIMMTSALHNAGVECELHIFRAGPHGLSVATSETAYNYPEGINPADAEWLKLSFTFLREVFEGRR